MARKTPALSILLVWATRSSASSGGEAGNSFQQQYTQKYAGQFAKYMSSGDQGKGGNLPGFAKHIIGQRASGFEKYMDEPGTQKNATAGGAVQSQGQGGQQPQSGSYQQYVDRSAVDYQKYMHQSGQQSQSGRQSQSGGYQQYMKQHGGAYAPFMGTGGAPGAAAFVAVPSSSQSADYDQYSKQYAGDYQKYTGQGGRQSQSSGYQGYVDRYAADYEKYTRPGGQESQSSGYQQYMKEYAGDYAHFLGVRSVPGATSLAGQPASAQAADYADYMKRYAGEYQGFMKSGGTGAQGADYEHYMKTYAGDYQNYMQQGGAAQLSGANASRGDAFEHSADGYVPHLENSSDLQALGDKAKADMDRYAAGYERYAHARAGGPRAPAAARDCHSLSDLKAWRAAKLAQLRSHVPKAYRASAEGSVQREFRSEEARIAREQTAGSHASSPAAAEKAGARKAGRAAPGSAGPHAARTGAASGERLPTAQQKSGAVATPAQLGSQEGAVELTEEARRIHMDGSIASVAMLAALGALFAAFVMVGRHRQSLATPEGYLTLAEP